MGDDTEHGAATKKKGLSTGALIGVIVGILVLVGVIGVGVMAALLLPALTKAKAKAYSTKCSNNLRQIGLGAIQYADDKRFYPHDPANPTGPGAIALMMAANYLDDPETFVCPHAPQTPQGYDGFVLPKLSSNTPSTHPIAWDAAPHPDGTRNVLFADCTVQLVQEAEFPAILEQAKTPPSR